MISRDGLVFGLGLAGGLLCVALLLLTACDRPNTATAPTPKVDVSGLSSTLEALPLNPPYLHGVRIPLTAALAAIYRKLDTALLSTTEHQTLIVAMQAYVDGREAGCAIDALQPITVAALGAERQTCLAKADEEQARLLGRRWLAAQLDMPPLDVDAMTADTAPLPARSEVKGIHRSDDGALLAVLWNDVDKQVGGGVALFARDGRQLRIAPLPFRPVWAQFSPNHCVLFATSHPDDPTQAHVMAAIEVASGETFLTEVDVTGRFEWLPDGRIVSLSAGVRLFDPRRGKLLAKINEDFSQFHLAMLDARNVIVADNYELTHLTLVGDSDALSWQRVDNTIIYPAQPSDSIAAMSVSQDRKTLLIATRDGALQVYDAAAMRLLRWTQLRGLKVNTARMLPIGGQWVALAVSDAGQQGTLLWNTHSMRGRLVSGEISTRNQFDKDLRGLAGDLAQLDHFKPPRASDTQPLAAIMSLAATQIAMHQAGQVMPIMNTSSDLDVEAVGVYEGTPDSSSTLRSGSGPLRTPAPVEIDIGRTDHPQVLVLSSYEPVIWRLKLDGALLQQILLSGNPYSVIPDMDAVPVSHIGPSFAFDEQGNGGHPHDFEAMNKAVRRYVGHDIDHFQGAYKGARFIIGDHPLNPARAMSTDARPDLAANPRTHNPDSSRDAPSASSAASDAGEANEAPPHASPPVVYRRVNERGVTEFSDRPLK